jgi:hypothetical protein
MSIKLTKKQVTDMHYEAHIQCIINWYAEHHGILLTKAEAREVKYFDSWQYMNVIALPYYRLVESSLVSLCVYFLYLGDSSILQFAEAMLC